MIKKENSGFPAARGIEEISYGKIFSFFSKNEESVVRQIYTGRTCGGYDEPYSQFLRKALRLEIKGRKKGAKRKNRHLFRK